MKTEEQLLREQELAEERELFGEPKEKAVSNDHIRKWRKAMANALVDGWHGDKHMSRVVHQAWMEMEKEAENTEQFYKLPAEMIGVRWINARDRAQVWIATNMRSLNEMLWAGRKREVCIIAAEKACGIRKNVGAPYYKGARIADKSHDWATVK